MAGRLLAVALLSCLLVAAQDAEDGEPKDKITKEMLLDKINEEKRFLIDSWDFVTKMTESYVEQMKESVQVSLLKDLNQEMYAALEVAEDTLIAAEEAGVLAEACVSRQEERARTMVEENIELMRLCVEDEAADGARLREGVRAAVDAAVPAVLALQRKLLDCIEESEKADPLLSESKHIKGCVQDEKVRQLTLEKDATDKEMSRQMERAREKQQKGNRCLADVMEQARADFSRLKTVIRECGGPARKEEL